MQVFLGLSALECISRLAGLLSLMFYPRRFGGLRVPRLPIGLVTKDEIRLPHKRMKTSLLITLRRKGDCRESPLLIELLEQLCEGASGKL